MNSLHRIDNVRAALPLLGDLRRKGVRLRLRPSLHSERPLGEVEDLVLFRRPDGSHEARGVLNWRGLYGSGGTLTRHDCELVRSAVDDEAYDLPSLLDLFHGGLFDAIVQGWAARRSTPPPASDGAGPASTHALRGRIAAALPCQRVRVRHELHGTTGQRPPFGRRLGRVTLGAGPAVGGRIVVVLGPDNSRPTRELWGRDPDRDAKTWRAVRSLVPPQYSLRIEVRCRSRALPRTTLGVNRLGGTSAFARTNSVARRAVPEPTHRSP